MTLRVPAGYRVGPWEVGAPIAAGAFGSVYEGRRPDGASERHGEPGRVALKFLPTGTRTPRQLHYLQDLAEREIALLRTLRRPRLIRMYEVLTVDDPGLPELDGACVLTLERADTSLDRLLTGSGPVPVDRVALLAQICEGLAQLHGAGWVHGDLKRVRLCDFDLAAELEGTHAYTFKHSNCRVLVGHAKGNDSSWSKKTNNKVSSIVNKGTGGTSKVKFYVGKKYKGGHICLKRSEKYVDNLSNDKFSTGQSANDAISSHKWVDNNAKCSAYMS